MTKRRWAVKRCFCCFENGDKGWQVYDKTSGQLYYEDYDACWANYKDALKQAKTLNDWESEVK